MPRYIDAMKIPYRHMYGDILIAEKDMIDAMPTISTDEVRGVGEWIRLDAHKWMAQYKCSACNTPMYVPECMGEPLHGFCPVCGARMKGTEDDDSV